MLSLLYSIFIHRGFSSSIKDLMRKYSTNWLHVWIGLVMFFCADDIKLQCFTTNKSLLTEMPVLLVILFYLQEETIQSRLLPTAK